MSDTELYGRQETEAAQGYQPMPEPVTAPDPELDHADAITKWAEDRAQEARPTIERQYFDEADKPQDEKKTVELDRAAKDLAENREAEAAVAEMDRNAQLAAEIDAARGFGRGESLRAQQEEAQQTGLEQPAPEVLEVLQQTEPQQPQYAPIDGVDPEVRAALQNPKVLAAVQQERVADLMRVEAAVNNATQWAQQNAAFAVAAIIARPELQGVPPGQYAGALQALKVSNPAAHADIERQITNTQAVIQQALQTQQQQQQRHAVAFQAWGNANDDIFEKSVANEPPETVRALRVQALQMFRDAGLSDQEISHHWQTNSLMRSALGQQIMADAARWRMAKGGIKPAPKPVPQVARPGSSMDRPAASDRNAFELENRYRGPLSAKQAAELVIGRRARSR